VSEKPGLVERAEAIAHGTPGGRLWKTSKALALAHLRAVQAETREEAAQIAAGWTFFRTDFEGDGDPAADIAAAIREGKP